jgi:hypothetical protein
VLNIMTSANRTFRGWYEFGGRSMADMGHYSLWAVFVSLNLPSAVSATPNTVGVYAIVNDSANLTHNYY